MAPYSGAMLAIGGAVGQRQIWSSPGPKNSTNLPTTPFLRSIWVTVSTRSVAVAPSGSLPVRRKPMTSGISMAIGWPSMAASASMPPTPQPSTPSAVDHGGVAVGAEQRVGIGEGRAVHLGGPHGLGQVFQVHLVADAGAGRHHAEIVERGLAPAQERVALAVALELDLDVLPQRVGACRSNPPSPSGRSPGRPAPAG